VAAARGRRVGRPGPDRPQPPVRRLRVRLGIGPRDDVRDQPLRSLRAAPGVETPPGTAARGAAVRHALALPRGASPALRRLVSRLLVHPDDDRDASALRARDDGLHPRRHPPRRARPHGAAPGIRGVPRASSDAHPVAAAARGRLHRRRSHGRPSHADARERRVGR
jgi:hypothetical protein